MQCISGKSQAQAVISCLWLFQGFPMIILKEEFENLELVSLKAGKHSPGVFKKKDCDHITHKNIKEIVILNNTTYKSQNRPADVRHKMWRF